MGTDSSTEVTLPERIVDCVTRAAAASLESILGDPPSVGEPAPSGPHDGVVGRISLSGEPSLTFEVGMSPETSAAVARRFVGVPVEYGSETMDDTIRELVNVVAGEIVSGLSRAGIEARMGLPEVTRGTDGATTVLRTTLRTAEGEIRIGVEVGTEG